MWTRVRFTWAILEDAPIVLLDQATASLDPENELYIQQAIGELVKGRTLIVIAHRLSTVTRADRILVLDGGVTVFTDVCGRSRNGPIRGSCDPSQRHQSH